MFRPSTGTWYVKTSSSGYATALTAVVYGRLVFLLPPLTNFCMIVYTYCRDVLIFKFCYDPLVFFLLRVMIFCVDLFCLICAVVYALPKLT